MRVVNRLLRPIGYIGAILVGGLIYHFAGDKIVAWFKEKFHK